GWVWMARLLAAPATSRSVPRSALVDIPITLAVPLRVRWPLTSGVPAVGRTRRFCQVSLQVTLLALELVTVKTICVVVTDDMGTAVPLAPLLILLAFVPVPVRRVITTVGAGLPVSNTNPAGTLRIMVPAPALLVAFSV